MKLKITRIIFASLIFTGFIYIFFTSSKLLIPVSKILTFFQFLPSLLNLLFQTLSIASIGFIIIILITFLFGRIYCSFLCPLGIFQDILIFISTKFKKKHKFIKDYSLLKKSILIVVIISSITGSLWILNLLDPYSIFSRIITNLIKPFIALVSNLFVLIMKNFKFYISNSFSIHKIEAGIFITTLASFILITAMALLKGRLFCNTICPVGTILGFISKYSLFKINIDKNKCTSCGVCEKTCKAGCIDTKQKSIDYSRCIDCFNCLDICSFNAIAFNKKIFIKQSMDSSKRAFLKESFYTIFGISIASSIPMRLFAKNKIQQVNTQKLITPPGSISLNNFINSCTGCNICVSSCPTKVLKPSLSKYGISGSMQPTMDYSTAYCDFECNTCSSVCPTGAIKRLPIKEKKRTQIGLVKLTKIDCIVYDKNQDCGACAEHCPTKAVFMIPYKDNLYAPETNKEICIGCGACEYVCPALPKKAISVTPNKIHKIAKLPAKKALNDNTKEKGIEEFPF